MRGGLGEGKRSLFSPTISPEKQRHKESSVHTCKTLTSGPEEFDLGLESWKAGNACLSLLQLATLTAPTVVMRAGLVHMLTGLIATTGRQREGIMNGRIHRESN